MFCPKCGYNNISEVLFCIKCGYKLPVLNDIEDANKPNAALNLSEGTANVQAKMVGANSIVHDSTMLQTEQIRNISNKTSAQSAQHYYQEPYQAQSYYQPVVQESYVIEPPIQKNISPTRVTFGAVFITAGILLLFMSGFITDLFRALKNAELIADKMYIPAVLALATGILLVASCKTFSGGYVSFLLLFILAIMFKGVNVVMIPLFIISGIILIVTAVAETEYNTAVKRRNQKIQEANQSRF